MNPEYNRIILAELKIPMVVLRYTTTSISIPPIGGLTVYMCSNNPFHPPLYFKDAWTVRINPYTMVVFTFRPDRLKDSSTRTVVQTLHNIPSFSPPLEQKCFESKDDHFSFKWTNKNLQVARVLIDNAYQYRPVQSPGNPNRTESSFLLSLVSTLLGHSHSHARRPCWEKRLTVYMCSHKPWAGLGRCELFRKP